MKSSIYDEMKRVRWAVNCSLWTPTKQEWLSCLSCLQEEEVERVRKFVYRCDYKLALVGRLLIRAGLCHVLNLPNSHVRLSRSDKGKPLLACEGDGSIDCKVAFNISHQGDFTVLAIEPDGQVGVDVMQLTRPRGVQNVVEFFHTMRKQFTCREWEQIRAPCANNEQQLNNFYRFWCLKESFIKAVGTGLSYGLQNLEFVADNQYTSWPPSDLSEVRVGSQLHIDGELMSGWRFHESLVDYQHCVAVAVQPPHELTGPDTRTFTHVPVHQLLDKLTLHRHTECWTVEAIDRKWEEFCTKQDTPQTSNRLQTV